MKKQILSTLLVGALSLSANAQVIATVNGDNVTAQDIKVLVSQMPPQLFANGITPQLQQKLINQAIDHKLLASDALKSGIEKDKDFQVALSELKKTIALDIWMKKVFKNTKVAEKDIKKFFEKNKEKMIEPKVAKVKHIIIKKDGEKKIKEIIASLKGLKGTALTDKFIALAKEKSEGPTGVNGGDLPWFQEGEMAPEFTKASFNLKPGEYTKSPIKTQFGYHVILLEDKKGGNKVTYENAKKRIESGLRMEKFQKSVADKAKELRKSAKIEIKK